MDKSVPIKRIGIKSERAMGWTEKLFVPTCHGRERGNEEFIYVI